MIKIDNVEKSYGKKKVLENINLDIEKASIFGLVGINGAGKSTLLRMMAGVMKPDKGSIFYDGENVYENETVKKNLFFLADDPYFSNHLKDTDMVNLYKSVYDFDMEKYNRIRSEFQLKAEGSIKNLSKGMRRQLFISLALATNPKILLLDEAFDGLDPLAKIIFKKEMRKLVEECGSTIVISSHSLRELSDFSDSYGIIDNLTIANYGKLNKNNSKENIHKYQIVLDKVIKKEELNIECFNYERLGHIIKIIAIGDKEEIEEKIKNLNPLFYEEIPVDFEEMFMYEVKNRGYIS